MTFLLSVGMGKLAPQTPSLLIFHKASVNHRSSFKNVNAGRTRVSDTQVLDLNEDESGGWHIFFRCDLPL